MVIFTLWDPGRKQLHKHFQLDAAKIRRTQKVFKAKARRKRLNAPWILRLRGTEKRVVAEANERFVRSGAEIRDVYGKLAD